MSKKIIYKKLPTGIVTKQIVEKNSTKIIVAKSFEEMGKFSSPYYLGDTFVSKYKNFIINFLNLISNENKNH